MKILAGMILLLLPAAQAAFGAATYLDAEGGVGGNTVYAATGSASGWYTADVAADQLWGRRAFGNDPDGALGTAEPADIFEATTTGGIEDCMAIRTTIAGLDPGQRYEVYIVYWSQNVNQNWSVRAGFGLDNLLLFDRTGASGAVAGTATGRIQGDRSELVGRVGQIKADAQGQIHVFVDDKPSTTNYAERTWYDGLLYEVLDASVCQAPPACDFSGPEGVPDCRVDMFDFAELAGAWMECSLIRQSACVYQ